MGVHIYRWLEKYAQQKHIDISFSYLDARTFQMVDDKRGRITGDLRNQISLNFQELINLHGYVRKNESLDDIDLFKNAVYRFKELIESNRLEDYFTTYNRELFIDGKSGQLITQVKKLKRKIESIGFKAQGEFLEIVKSLPENYRLFNEDGSFREPKTNKELEKVLEFLDGRWFEQFIYDVLKKNIKNNRTTIDINWKFKKPEWQSPEQNFELDIILITGYQLIGISCTTSNKKGLCKGKGFEIFMRARQIGGEEARSILMTRLPEGKKGELQQELDIDTGGRENILILGGDDLREDILISKIEDYIK